MFDRSQFLGFLKEAQNYYPIVVSLGDEGYEYGGHGVSPVSFESPHPPLKMKQSVADGHPSHMEEILRQLKAKKT